MTGSPETFLDGRVTLWCGDMLGVLPQIAENSIDSVVCDPPYHLHSIVKRFAKTGRTDKTRSSSGPHQRTATGFMNKKWDGGNIAFQVETWRDVLRVLKPGGYIVAFSSSRTFGRMSVAIEDAGFITHPLIGWIFGQGFPKAHRVHLEGFEGFRYGGQALKPALEPIYMGQKPFVEINGTRNVEEWGTGALNIDGCRVATADWDAKAMDRVNSVGSARNYDRTARQTEAGQWDGPIGTGPMDTTKGRWPANVIHDGSDEVLTAFPDAPGAFASVRGDEPSNSARYVFGGLAGRHAPRERIGDAGSAARFFYTAKADADDRLGSKHPTVKPLDLMQYLVRLVTPPKGLVLDPFAGTGTTAEAAYREGFSAVLIEREPEYQDDIRRRMRLVLGGPDERARESIKAKLKDKPVDHGPLFDNYDAAKDFDGSINDCYTEVRERIAAGGPPWEAP